MTQIAKPLFQQALGDEAWQRLAPAVQRHYRMGHAEAEEQELKGQMDEIFHAPYAKPLLWLAGRFGGLVARGGRDVPVTVRNWTDPARPNVLFWHRTFRFSDSDHCIFRSCMERIGKSDEIVESLRYGVGIRMRVEERDGALVYTALSHGWKIGSRFLPIPNWMLLGDAVIVERAIADDELYLDFVIHHPWFGKTFGYRGRFTFPR